MPAPSASARFAWPVAFSPRFLAAPSVLALILASLLPLYGVLSWGWSLYGLMVLYWMETGIVGIFAIIQMAIAARWLALLLVPFFIVHLGGFMAAHIFFLTIMFGGGWPNEPARLSDLVWTLLVGQGLWLGLAALAVSHSVSFVLNVLRPYRRGAHQPVGRSGGTIETLAPGDPRSAMMAPYGRIVIMHVTIIFGAWLTALLQTRAAAFALLIALKIVADVAAHVRKNFRPAAA